MTLVKTGNIKNKFIIHQGGSKNKGKLHQSFAPCPPKLRTCYGFIHLMVLWLHMLCTSKVLLAGTYYVESGCHCLALNLQVLVQVQSGLRLLSQVNLAGSSKLPTKTGAHKVSNKLPTTLLFASYIYILHHFNLVIEIKLRGGKGTIEKSKI